MECSDYGEKLGPAGFSRCSSSLSSCMLMRVASVLSSHSLNSTTPAGEGDHAERIPSAALQSPMGLQETSTEDAPLSLLDVMRAKAVLKPMLQDASELHPAALRFADRCVAGLLHDRLLSDDEVFAEIHQHFAEHLVMAAGGKWQAGTGVAFTPDAAKLLGHHLISIRWLPFHLEMAQHWTDCVQLLCDLHFLQVHFRLWPVPKN